MASMLIIGVACEAVFLVTRYRRFGLTVLLVGGAAAGLASLAPVYVPFGLQRLAPVVQIAFVAEYALSGAVLGGLLAKLLSDALAKTGVLSAYAVGRERREEV